MTVATTYTTYEFDRLDGICWRHYGHLARAVERVLEANPHLAEQPAILPEGVTILLPDIPPPAPARIHLW